MTQAEIKKAQRELEKHYEYLGRILSLEVMEIIAGVVELEIELTAEDGR